MADARVLIVDDDPALLRVVEVGLTARGYEVLTAGNGHDALDASDVANIGQRISAEHHEVRGEAGRDRPELVRAIEPRTDTAGSPASG